MSDTCNGCGNALPTDTGAYCRYCGDPVGRTTYERRARRAGRATVIQAASYGENEAELREDPIIQAMAQDIAHGISRGHVTLDSLEFGPGEPRHEFTMRALSAYKDKGGKLAQHIGGPANAVLKVVRERLAADDLYERVTGESVAHEPTEGRTYVRTVSVFVDGVNSPEEASAKVVVLSASAMAKGFGVHIRLPDNDSEYQWEAM